MTSLCEGFMYVHVYIYIYSIYILVVCTCCHTITYTGRTFLQCAHKVQVLGLLHFSLLHTLIYLTGTIVCLFASEISGIYSTQRNRCFSLEAMFSHLTAIPCSCFTKAFMDFLRMFLDCSDAEAF